MRPSRRRFLPSRAHPTASVARMIEEGGGVLGMFSPGSGLVIAREATQSRVHGRISCPWLLRRSRSSQWRPMEHLAPEQRGGTARRVIYRHAVTIRITHWVNVLCLALLLMSGLQIFNAHPALYWGDKSDFDHPVLAMMAAPTQSGRPAGFTNILGHYFVTTGVLGLSTGPSGQPEARGFPSWATIPSWQDLAMGRRWHFFFAWLFLVNGLAYLAYSLAARHIGDLVPSGPQMSGIGRSILDHVRLRFPKGEEARHYNVLQKLSYLVVIFVLLPLMLLTGLTMSPGMDSAFPQLLSVFGGRQTARTIH